MNNFYQNHYCSLQNLPIYTEESDAVAIVVSEETGVISIAQAGKIVRYMTPERLLDEIKLAYNVSAKAKTNEKKGP